MKLHPGRTGGLRSVLAAVARALDFDHATVWLIDAKPYRILASTDTGVRDRTHRVRKLIEGSAGEALTVDDLGGAEGGAAYLGVPLSEEPGRPAAMLILSRSRPEPISIEDVSLASYLRHAVIEFLDQLQRTNPTEPDDAELDVARAINAGEILPWYQPIVEMKTGSVIGVEALARWPRPTGDVVIPGIFVRVAERSDLIVDLDLGVMGQAVLDLRLWQRVSSGLRLSVNLSGRLLDQAGWDQAVCNVVGEAGISPDSIDLELSETTRPPDLKSFNAVIQQLRSQGFGIWLDDIGSGWFGLHDWKSLQVDGIKMEPTFANLLGTPAEEAVRAVASAAAERRVRVTLEGIETADQAQLARELGCDYGQGYFWCRPVPATMITGLLVPHNRE
jgi:EAL domain-containing protein (putative c-di-GMP-specific phosphodiesterase class I)